jgi:ketosteroid isomerase-like protein
MSEHPNIAMVREYLAAVSRGDTGDRVSKYFDADYRQTEYPNVLNKNGQKSDLAHSLQRAEQGKKLLTSQRYDVRTAMASGDHVALEVDWTGTLAIPALGLPAGGEMKAHFAMFIEVRGGKIWRQRNYDCFEPWT